MYCPPANGCSSFWWPRLNRCDELELGAVADLADPARQREPAPRAVLRVVVVAAAEVRVVLDRADLQRAQPDLLGGRGRAARDDHRVRDPLGIGHRPLERALTAHRSAHHRRPPLDAERVGEHRLHRDLVADRDRREAANRTDGRSRDRRRRPGRSLAAAEHVGAHDEELVGVDRAPGPDERVPPPDLDVPGLDRRRPRGCRR